MSPEKPYSPSSRILILMPAQKDAQATARIFSDHNLESFICGSLQELCGEINKGAGAAVLTEELILTDKTGILYATLQNEPPWSDFPLLVLTPAGHSSDAAIKALEAIGHMTLIQRPVQITEILSAMRSGLRDRKRQYKVRDYLIERDKQEALLREADKRKDDFLAILAHELRNPLAPISNAMPILQSEKTTKAMRFEAMDIIARQVDQMVRLVDDLMDVSRIRGGKIELRKERIRLRDVIANAVETARPLLDDHRHTLKVDLPETFTYVNADFVRLSQIISNLLNNAAKYTERDGEITLTVSRSGNQAAISVRDNGIGIPEAMQPRIFDMFTQVDGTLERAQGGIGIGLMLVKNLIEMHGGSVEVKSEGSGKGSEFILHLPLAEEEEQSPVRNEEGQPISEMIPKRILLVEDYKVLAQMTSWALELEGHEVRVAQDGPSAIALAKEYRPDVVLMDIGLPGMNGYEACEVLRKEPSLKDTVFIAQTGWGQEEHRQRSKAAGFHFHLVKPVDPAALHDLLYSTGNASQVKTPAMSA